MCDDPELEVQAASHLIVGAGFAVDGLREHLEGRDDAMRVDVLIPFPAESWQSIRRSWSSAQEIFSSLEVDSESGTSLAPLGPKPVSSRQGARRRTPIGSSTMAETYTHHDEIC